jgi:hypothetical protein
MRKPWRFILAGVMAVFAIGALWLYGMQYVAIAFDTVATQRLEAKALPNFAWNGLYLAANGHMLDLELPDKPAVSARVEAVSGKRLTLVQDGKRILLGSGTPSVIDDAQTIKPATVFALEPGDRLFLPVERSWLEWPTFFTTNFMTGNSPTWTGSARRMTRPAD